MRYGGFLMKLNLLYNIHSVKQTTDLIIQRKIQKHKEPQIEDINKDKTKNPKCVFLKNCRQNKLSRSNNFIKDKISIWKKDQCVCRWKATVTFLAKYNFSKLSLYGFKKVY